MIGTFTEVAEVTKKISECPLAKIAKEMELDPDITKYDIPIGKIGATDLMNGLKKDSKNIREIGELDKVLKEYFLDLRSRSEYPETIPEQPFSASDLEKLSPEETAEKRQEFNKVKDKIKREWEAEHGMEWPKYEQDVYSENGRLIRRAGDDYDAHHIKPLGLGGENTSSNITPMHANEHFDSQGVHSPDSPYKQIEKKMGDAA